MRFLWLPQWLICILVNFFRTRMGLPPSLRCWLSAHQTVSAAIKWQSTDGEEANLIVRTLRDPLVDAVLGRWDWFRAFVERLDRHFGPSTRN